MRTADIKILETLDRGYVAQYLDSLDLRPSEHRALQAVVHKCPYWQRIKVGICCFRHLVLNSTPTERQPQPGSFPMMHEVLEGIESDPSFFSEDHPYYDRRDDGLGGKDVRRYRDEFRTGSPEWTPADRLKDCVISDTTADGRSVATLRLHGSFYIIDGMHRLVAYGVYSDLDHKVFPIAVLCGTATRLLQSDGGVTIR